MEAAETVRVEDAEPFAGNAKPVELKETVGPLGEIAAVRAIVPVKPLRLVNVRVAGPDDPWAKVSMVGFDVAVKSGLVAVLDWTTRLPVMCCRCIEQ
jgi:hypothetical protein